jgi:hypothetical protein
MIIRRFSSLVLAIVLFALAGCSTTSASQQAETNYTKYVTAMQAVSVAEREAEKAQHLAAQQRIGSLYDLAAKSTDASIRQSAFTALLLSGQNAPAQAAPRSVVQLAPPPPPVNEALEWAKVLANPITTVGLGWLNYKLGVVQSDNSTKTELNRWDVMKDMNRVGVENAGKVVYPVVVHGAGTTVTAPEPGSSTSVPAEPVVTTTPTTTTP